MRQGCELMPGKIHFGVYELDCDAMELRKHGVPIRLQEQPFRVLATLVERPGQIVTREELQERIWGKDTFVDFDQSLNKAVNRVREALNDDAARPQYVETVPRRGYRFVAPVTGIALSEPHRPIAASSGTPDSPSINQKARGRRFTKIAAPVLVGALAILGIAAAMWSRKQHESTPRGESRHMTAGGFDPALSKDGKLLAYTSNAGSNVLHVWVRQTAGGEAVPVTSGPDPDCCFDLSPDGTRVAFASARGGGGLYITPTLSGEPRLLAKSPKVPTANPRFSPDGTSILFIQEEKLFTVSAGGGIPVALPLSANFRVNYASPLWAPSGDAILFYGMDRRKPEQLDRWWVVSLNGGEPKLMLLPVMRQDVMGFQPLRAWTRTKDGRDWIVYSVATGDNWKLFRVETSRQGEVSGNPEELASGTGLLAEGASLAEDGKLAYTTLTFRQSIFEIPMNDRGEKQGPTLQLPFSEEGSFDAPSVSRDGRWLVYGSYRLGNPRTMMLRDLQTGTDRFLDDKGHEIGRGADTSISPDGSKVIFERDCGEGNWPSSGAIPCSLILPTGGSGQAERVCGACSARGFSSDGSVVLIQKYPTGSRNKIVRLDLATKTEKDFLSLSDRDVYHAFFSWDNRWVVFKKLESGPTQVAQIFIAPVRHGVAGKEAEWIPVTDGLHRDDKPQFSPDGNTLYFTSTRDGYLCIWSQKLDPVTKHPVGAPIGYEHFHNSAGRDAVSFAELQWDLTVARDKMLINLPRISTEVWMLQTQ